MMYRKFMKVVLNATNLDLDKLRWPNVEQLEDEIVGVATLKALDRNISTEQLENAGRLLLDYLEIRNGTAEHKSEPAGPFIFEIEEKEDLLSFIRELQNEFMKYRECDFMKLEVNFQ